MLRSKSLICILILMFACRSTTKSMPSSHLESREAVLGSTIQPLSLADGLSCLRGKSSQVQCLDGSGSQSWRPLLRNGSMASLRSLSARGERVCGLDAKAQLMDRLVLCWSLGSLNESGATALEPISLDLQAEGLIQALALSRDGLCVLGKDAEVSCSSLAPSSVGVGNKSKTKLNMLKIKGLNAISGIRAGDGFACGWRRDTGAIFCWGDNSRNQLGIGSQLAAEKEAVAIAGFSGAAVLVELGARHACAINESGEVFCWGDNQEGQLGVEVKTRQSPLPLLVRGLPEKAEALALGDQHSCALLKDGSVWCWGLGGRLGAETLSSSFVPLRVRLLEASRSIAAGSQHSCSQRLSGEIFCWGRNIQGELGNGTQVDAIFPEPMRVPQEKP